MRQEVPQIIPILQLFPHSLSLSLNNDDDDRHLTCEGMQDKVYLFGDVTLSSGISLALSRVDHVHITRGKRIAIQV